MLSGCFPESLRTYSVRYLEKCPVTGKRQSHKDVLRDMEFSDIPKSHYIGKVVMLSGQGLLKDFSSGRRLGPVA